MKRSRSSNEGGRIGSDPDRGGVIDRSSGKTIDDVRRFWSANPLFVGEGSHAPGTREWFEEHERIYLNDCLAGEPPAVFSDGLSYDARILDVGCGPGFFCAA